MNATTAISTETTSVPRRQQALTAATGQAAIGVTHFCPVVGENQEYVAKMCGENAFVVLFQLRDMPAHDFKLDDKLERVCHIPRATLHIVDLRIGEACGGLFHRVDTLMFHMPMSAIAEIPIILSALQIVFGAPAHLSKMG